MQFPQEHRPTLTPMQVGITGNRVFRPNVRPGLYRRDWSRTACRYHRSISLPLDSSFSLSLDFAVPSAPKWLYGSCRGYPIRGSIFFRDKRQRPVFSTLGNFQTAPPSSTANGFVYLKPEGAAEMGEDYVTAAERTVCLRSGYVGHVGRKAMGENGTDYDARTPRTR